MGWLGGIRRRVDGVSALAQALVNTVGCLLVARVDAKKSLGVLEVNWLDQLASKAALSHAMRYKDLCKSISELGKPFNPFIHRLR